MKRQTATIDITNLHCHSCFEGCNFSLLSPTLVQLADRLGAKGKRCLSPLDGEPIHSRVTEYDEVSIQT